MRDPLDEALDLPSIPSEEKPVEEEPAEDFEFARKKLRKALTVGLKALEELAEVAHVSQHARAYEVVANLMGTIGRVGNELIELSQRDADLKAPSDDEGTPEGRFLTSEQMLERVTTSAQQSKTPA